jgi:hypothetical protein
MAFPDLFVKNIKKIIAKNNTYIISLKALSGIRPVPTEAGTASTKSMFNNHKDILKNHNICNFFLNLLYCTTI